MKRGDHYKNYDTVDEFIADGGDQIAVDLAKQARTGVADAISRAMQLAEYSANPASCALLIQGSSHGTCLSLLYAQACLIDDRLIQPREFIKSLSAQMVDVLAHEVKHVLALLDKQRKMAQEKQSDD